MQPSACIHVIGQDVEQDLRPSWVAATELISNYHDREYLPSNQAAAQVQ